MNEDLAADFVIVGGGERLRVTARRDVIVSAEAMGSPAWRANGLTWIGRRLLPLQCELEPMHYVMGSNGLRKQDQCAVRNDFGMQGRGWKGRDEDGRRRIPSAAKRFASRKYRKDRDDLQLASRKLSD